MLITGFRLVFDRMNKGHLLSNFSMTATWLHVLFQANKDGLVSADGTEKLWKDDDPTLFFMTIIGTVIPDDTTIITIEKMTKEPITQPPPPPIVPPSTDLIVDELHVRVIIIINSLENLKCHNWQSCPWNINHAHFD